ncbi:PREDICTED: bifunctional monothiol glutaredoxin-S16, chloroplastic isoform X2 [Camelina sativa]|uniref:Bifunctional monothiol glutaredoxin-S16, chloroplastic isoform X1 n=1 Tax=Camelina sativa TaxID=90675 RepID=A0ABM0YT16_CAMSA|nr:PREDICTED: bifunctional monothiol glutaredoxin-S16, chloroplastic isoform X1 [Camelina sativa]XP_010505447.1 PREDICTED: bifunctional monothiol glutaredoxin-S16, chloroplastic isoform X2 [Camelina sativa]
MAAISFGSSLHASASLRVFRPQVSRNTPGIALYSRFTPPSFSFPSLSFTLRDTERSRRRPFLIVSAVKSLTETELLPISESDSIPSASGVYAVYDKSDELQFVGISRNIASSVSAHLKSVPELCGSVKVGIVEEPDKAVLTQAWKSWIEEHIKETGKVPPGNKSGNNTFVKQTPRKKSDIRLTPGRHVELTVPLEELIDRLVKESKVVAFIKGSRSAPQCGFSQRVVGILESQGVDYETVDVLDDEFNPGLREKLKNYSNWPTFPQIFVKGELVGGCDILTSMYENGELGNVLN